METLTIGFSKAKSKWKIMSPIIRWIEGIPFSHVYIRWNSKYLERDVVYQASGTMVHFLEGKRFDDINETVDKFDILLSSEAKKKTVQFAMDRAGIGYSFKQLIGLSIAKLLKSLGFKPVNPFKDGRSGYVCCELVAEVLVENGFDFKQDLDEIFVKDVYDFLLRVENGSKG